MMTKNSWAGNELKCKHKLKQGNYCNKLQIPNYVLNVEKSTLMAKRHPPTTQDVDRYPTGEHAHEISPDKTRKPLKGTTQSKESNLQVTP